MDRLAAADSVRIQLGRAQPVALPLAFKPKLLALLRLAAEGQAVQIDSCAPTLTTQQVADRLGVSRPYVVALIAKAFGVAKRDVTLVLGETDRRKVVHVAGDAPALAVIAQQWMPQ